MGRVFCRFDAFAILLLVFFMSLSAFSDYAEAAWLGSWAYRKQHDIIGTVVGAQVDYQMRFKVHRNNDDEDGMPTAEDVYVGTKCRADFGDIRFTDSGGADELHYWIEEINGDVATIWVNIPNIPIFPDTVSIYMYYGNAGETTTSNGYTTFPEFFDDFEDGDVSDWALSQGSHSATTTSYSGTYARKLYNDGSAGGVDEKTFAPVSGKRMWMFRARNDKTSIRTNIHLMSGTTYALGLRFQEDGTFGYLDSGGWTIGIGSYSAGTWYDFRVIFDTDTDTYSAYAGGTTIVEGAAFRDIVASIDREKDLGGYSGVAGDGVIMDNILIRKYVSDEPDHVGWAGEDPLNTEPEMDFLSESTDPIQEGAMQTITPSGVSDAELDSLHIYCCQTTGTSCTPTTADVCNNDQAWGTPYGGMNCQLTAPSVSAPTTYTVFCRLYDGSLYSGLESTRVVVKDSPQSCSVSPSGNPPWLSGDWPYRKNHALCSATGAGTGYQVRIVVHSGNGVDSGEHVYLKGHATNWPNDIRFTDDNGQTELPYWLESSSADTATFWVKVADDLGTADRDIWIYYGNGAGSGSSFSSVTDAELANPDFEDTATCLEPNSMSDPNFGWIQSDNTAEEDCWEVDGGVAHSGTNSLGSDYACTGVCGGADKEVGNAGTYPTTYIHQNISVDSSRRYLVNVSFWAQGALYDLRNCSDIAEAGGEDDARLRMVFCDSGNTEIGSYLGPSFSGLGYFQNWVWHKYEDSLALTPSGTAKITVQVEGGDNNYRCGGFVGGGNAGGYFDDFFLFARKYVSPEPGHGEWGTERTPDPPPIWNENDGYFGSNLTKVAHGGVVRLFAQIKDETALDWAWLATDEEGYWKIYNLPHIDPSWVDFTGLIGLWHLDTVSAGITPDSSGYNRDGSLGGDAVIVDGGKYGGGISFDGDADLVDIGDVLAGDENKMTVAAWVKPSMITGTDYFVGEGGSFRLSVRDNGQAGCWLRGDNIGGVDISEYMWTTTTPITVVNEWYHIACVWDGTTGDVEIYVNGIAGFEGKTNVARFNGDGNNFAIGRGYKTMLNEFAGVIDEVAVWDRDLSSQEILEIYRKRHDSPMKMVADSSWQWSNFTWRNPDVTPGTVVHWKIYFNDTSGNEVVTDEGAFEVMPATPELSYLSYSGDLEQMDVNWVAEYNETTADPVYVSCKLNDQFCSYKDFVPELNGSWINLDGLVGYWKFNEGAGKTVYDSSDRGYDGSLFGTLLGDFEGDLDGWTASCGGGSEVIQLTTDAYEGSGAVEIVLGCIYKAVTAVDGQNMYYAVKPTGGNYDNPCLWAESECKNTRPAELVETIGDWRIYKTRSEYDGAAGWHLYGSAGTIYDFITMSPIWTEGKYGGALEFDGIDDRVDIPFTENLSSGYTVNMWFKPDEVQNTIPLTYQSEDNVGDTGEYYSGDLGRIGIRGLKDTHPVGNLVYVNLGSGWDGPFSLTHLSRVADNTQAVQAWEFRVREDGVVRWSYSKNANNYVSTEYRWWESPIWVFEPTKTYELELYWPGNVDFYSDRIAVMSRRAGILRVEQFRCMFNRYDDYLDVGFYTYKSDKTWDASGRWVYNVVPLTGWHMVTWIHNTSSKMIYVDGELKANWDDIGDIYDSSGILRVGYGWMYWLGAIDDVNIWNRTLSSDEVYRIYAGGYGYAGPEGGGSCQFMPPQYDMTQNDTVPTKTVRNMLNCTACNYNHQDYCDNVVKSFYPIDFAVSAPNEVVLPVGQTENIQITFLNMGLLSDNYSVNVSSLNPSGLRVIDGNKSTGVLDQGEDKELYVGFVGLTSEQKSTARLFANSSVSPWISFEKEISVTSHDKVLPDFGLLGILQIMISAAALFAFLLTRD